MDDDGTIVDVVKMPETERDIFDLLHEWREAHDRIHATLEFVRAMPRQGVSSTFKFGWGYGGLRMALIATGIPFEEVTPAKWQGALRCRSGGDKNVTKRKAQELWPARKWTHATSDSALICEYGRRNG